MEAAIHEEKIVSKLTSIDFVFGRETTFYLEELQDTKKKK